MTKIRNINCDYRREICANLIYKKLISETGLDAHQLRQIREFRYGYSKIPAAQRRSRTERQRVELSGHPDGVFIESACVCINCATPR